MGIAIVKRADQARAQATDYESTTPSVQKVAEFVRIRSRCIRILTNSATLSSQASSSNQVQLLQKKSDTVVPVEGRCVAAVSFPVHRLAGDIF